MMVLREYVKTWTKNNYHLVEATECIWKGERNIEVIMSTGHVEPADYGSRFCILQTLKMVAEFCGERQAESSPATEGMKIVASISSQEMIELEEDIPSQDGKMTAPEEPKFLVKMIEFGRADEAAAGLRAFVGLDDQVTFALVMEDPLRSMRREWFEHGSSEDKQNFNYVVSGRACEEEHAYFPAHVKESIAAGKYHGGILKPGEFDAGHQGMTLQDFVDLQQCRDAALQPFHVAALRLYSSSSYLLFTQPLRSRTRPHPIKTTVYVLDEAIRKMRQVHAKRNKHKFTTTTTLWRGLANATMDFEKFR